LKTSPPAPPEGLFLHHVAYPENAQEPLADRLLHPPTQ
jgi:tRNA U38,U39,U40 pseudouridine synthase TruA